MPATPHYGQYFPHELYMSIQLGRTPVEEDSRIGGSSIIKCLSGEIDWVSLVVFQHFNPLIVATVVLYIRQLQWLCPPKALSSPQCLYTLLFLTEDWSNLRYGLLVRLLSIFIVLGNMNITNFRNIVGQGPFLLSTWGKQQSQE